MKGRRQRAGVMLHLRGWLHDRYRNLLIRALRHIGPEVRSLAEVPRGISVEAEGRLLRSMSREQLVLYIAARSSRRRPSLEDLAQLLGGGDPAPCEWGVWFRASEHPLIDAFDVVRNGESGAVEYFRFWWRPPTLPLPFLIRSFGRYGGVYGRLAQSREDDTEFRFSYFRGGALQSVFASGDGFYYSPLDRPEVAGNPSRRIVEDALAAAGLEADGSVLYFDRDLRGYRACREADVRLRLVGFSFQRRGGHGPWV